MQRVTGGLHRLRVNDEWHHSLSLLGIIFLFIRATSGFALASRGFAFERTTVFRCDIASEGITVFRSTMLLLIARTLANSGFAFEGTTVFRWGVATEGIAVFRRTMLPLIARTFANSGFAFEGTTVLRCGTTTGGISKQELPLIARRRRDCLKLMLSAVCCDKFLTLWDLVSSVFEVSFWAKSFEP